MRKGMYRSIWIHFHRISKSCNRTAHHELSGVGWGTGRHFSTNSI